MPVAPYLSRMYGTGDTFQAVRVAYFSGTEDAFASTKVHPSNDKPPRIGVTAVECSVEGNFYSHLPKSTELYGPLVVGTNKGGSVGEMLRQLLHFDVDDEGNKRKELMSVTTNAEDPQGLAVCGHTYTPSGLQFTVEPEQIVVDVKMKTKEDIPSKQEHLSHMPRQNNRDMEIRTSKIANFFPGGKRDSVGSIMVRVPAEEMVRLEEDDDDDDDADTGTESKSAKTQIAGLEIRDWARSSKKAALIYFPGYNCPLKWATEALGQVSSTSKPDINYVCWCIDMRFPSYISVGCIYLLLPHFVSVYGHDKSIHARLPDCLCVAVFSTIQPPRRIRRCCYGAQ